MGELDGCLLARFPGAAPPAPLRRWLEEGLGGVVLFAENITGPGQLRALAGELRSHNPGLVIAVDEESGIVTRLEARTGSSYPGNAALGAAGDTALTRRVARSIGAMLAAAGVNLNLAPVADLDASPANPIIGVRSFGADPHQVAAQTEGLDGRRGLGWGLRGDRWDNMGDGWPAAGAGHTGFTGTSLSLDPGSGLWAVLVTNAVHFGRGPEHSVVGLRKRVHAAVAAALAAG